MRPKLRMRAKQSPHKRCGRASQRSRSSLNRTALRSNSRWNSMACMLSRRQHLQLPLPFVQLRQFEVVGDRTLLLRNNCHTGTRQHLRPANKVLGRGELQHPDLAVVADHRIDVIARRRLPATIKRQLGKSTRIERSRGDSRRQCALQARQSAMRNEQRHNGSARPRGFMCTQVVDRVHCGCAP